MGLEGSFLTEVQEHVAALTEGYDAVILDAATGAGETTLQIAEAMKGGRLITVDSDAASWAEWARPALERAGLIDRVEFLQADLRELSTIDSDSADLVVSHSTLSVMGVWAVEAIQEFHRILKPGAKLALADLLAEDESEPDPDNVSALSWRLAKAAAHLAGKAHYEELPGTWVRARLIDAAFEIISFESHPQRSPASEASCQEWRGIDPSSDIQDEILKQAIRQKHEQYARRAEAEGLTTKTGYYTCWAGKIGQS